MTAEKPMFIAIEGPIGVGKSALINALENEYGKNSIRAFREEFELDRILLDHFYSDKKKFAFQTQIVFLLSRFKQCENMQKELKQPEMFSDIKLYLSDFIFEKNDIFAELTIDDEQEWKLYQKMRKLLSETTSTFEKPNFIVYLRSGEETLFRGIQQQSDNARKGITRDYLKQLTSLYDRFFFHYKECPVLTIDLNNIDFVHNNAPASASPISVILEAIKKTIASPPEQNVYIKLEGAQKSSL